MMGGADMAPRIRELSDDDVMLGRGYKAIENEGNVRFRELVRSRSSEYHAAYRRHTKDSIAREVVNTILRRNGRFLTQLDDAANLKGLVVPAGACVWMEADEAAVLVKAKQALRDHSDDAKEGRPIRRRPAAGSGNVVLEWVPPRPPSSAQAGSETSFSTVVTTSEAASSNSAQAISGIGPGGTSLQPQQNLASLLSSLPLGFAGFSSLGLSGLPQAVGLESRASDPLSSVNSTAAVAALHQHLLHGAQLNPQAFPPATLQAAMQQIMGSQGVTRSRLGPAGGFASNFQGTPESSLASLQRMLGPQVSLPVSDQEISSSAPTLLSVQSQLSGGGSGSVGSRAHMTISRAVEQVSSSSACIGSPGHDSSNVLLCGLEVSLLKVLCNYGLPHWTRETRESAFAAPSPRQEGSLALQTWTDIGQHLLSECQSDTTASTAAQALYNNPYTLARMVIFLTKRCVDGTKGVAATAAALSASATSALGGDGGPASGQFAMKEGNEVAVVEHSLTQWSLELDECKHLDGTFVAGSMLETLHALPDDSSSITPDEKRVSLASSQPAALLNAGRDCQTIVETMATLLQLQWIFRYHSTSTIVSILSSQEGDTSRDYLLLKGVLSHGLTNELNFRIQGSTTTRGAVEDRIYLLTRLLFRHLHDLKKKEATKSLKRKYTEWL